jgi:hypothetical protein
MTSHMEPLGYSEPSTVTVRVGKGFDRSLPVERGPVATLSPIQQFSASAETLDKRSGRICSVSPSLNGVGAIPERPFLFSSMSKILAGRRPVTLPVRPV